MLRAIRGLILGVMGIAGLCLLAALTDPAAALADSGTAQLSGRITAADGTPITAYPVCAYAYAYDANAYPATTTLVAVRAADRTGSYTLPRLAAATYVVGFADCRTAAGNDAPQYAPGVTNVDSAHQYVLTPGQHVTGVDSELQPGTSISGHLTAASDSHPLAGICVDATSFGTVGGPLATVHGTTRSDGSYTLSRLPVLGASGTYSLTFSDCNSPRVYLSEPASSPVSPTVSQPATGVDAQLQAGASISGLVTDAQGAPIRSRDICVSARPEDYLHIGPNSFDSTRTDAAGRYQLGALAGDSYSVRFQDCATDQSLSPRNDATVLESVSVSNAAAAVHTEQMTPGATISGHVYAGPDTSTPVAGACVRVTTRLSLLSVHAPALDETVTTNASGAYALGHLAPASAWYVGGWLVAFSQCQSSSDTTWYDGAGDASQATPLQLTTGQSVTKIDGHLPGQTPNHAQLRASMATVLHKLLRPVVTAAHAIRSTGSWRLPATAAGTWSARVTVASPGRHHGLIVYRGSAHLGRTGRARIAVRLTPAGRVWLRSGVAHRARVRLHALLTFRAAGRQPAVAVTWDFRVRPR